MHTDMYSFFATTEQAQGEVGSRGSHRVRIRLLLLSVPDDVDDSRFIKAPYAPVCCVPQIDTYICVSPFETERVPWWLRDENSKAIACMSVCVCVVQLGTVEKARVLVSEKKSQTSPLRYYCW